jgi:hypothetical protein
MAEFGEQPKDSSVRLSRVKIDKRMDTRANTVDDKRKRDS